VSVMLRSRQSRLNFFSLDALAREIRTSVVGADDLCAASSGSRVRSD